MPSFTLHPQLAQDCIVLGELSISKVLLFNGDAFPWFILVPQAQSSNDAAEASYTKEWHHLNNESQRLAFEDSMAFSAFLESEYTPDKINIASLGNMVPQLHIHHIARFTTDAAWPAPIWGHPDKGNAYTAAQINTITTRLKDHFSEHFTPA